jgi:hypothetical protein
MQAQRELAATVVPSGPPLEGTLVRAGHTYRVKRCPGANGATCIKGGAWLRGKHAVCGACVERATVWNGLVSAARVRRHVAKLARQGVGYKQVADAAGVATSSLGAVLFGSRDLVRRDTERRILEVTAAAVADHGLVPAERTWKLIGKLLDEGFTKAELARRLGSKARQPSLQFRRDRVHARTEHRVKRFYNAVMT